jgi:hypothetical protein
MCQKLDAKQIGASARSSIVGKMLFFSLCNFMLDNCHCSALARSEEEIDRICAKFAPNCAKSASKTGPNCATKTESSHLQTPASHPCSSFSSGLIPAGERLHDLEKLELLIQKRLLLMLRDQ